MWWMGPYNLKKAWRVEWLDSPGTVSFRASNQTRSQVRYNYYLDLHDVIQIKIQRIRVTRAPEYDHLARAIDPITNGRKDNSLGWYDENTGERYGCCEEDE